MPNTNKKPMDWGGGTITPTYDSTGGLSSVKSTPAASAPIQPTGVAARGFLEGLTGVSNVGYDEATKGVTVDYGGQTYNLGNRGLTNYNGSYYADNEDVLKQLFLGGTGLKPLRNTAQLGGHSVGNAGANPIIDGKTYSTDGMVNIGGTNYVGDDFLRALSEANPKYSNSQFTDRQWDIFDKLMNSEFTWDASTDKNLQSAMDVVKQGVYNDAADRGILTSGDALYNAGLAAEQLVPQYEQMAYSRYRDEKQDLVSLSNMLSNMSAEDRAVWQANETKRYNDFNMTWQAEKNALDKEKYEWEKAVEKTNTLGYVDNPSSVVLGLDPGTPSADARKRIEDREDWFIQQDRILQDRKSEMDYQAAINEQASVAAHERDKDFYSYQTDESIREHGQRSSIDVDTQAKIDRISRQIAIEFAIPEAEAQAQAQALVLQNYPQLFSSGSGGGTRKTGDGYYNDSPTGDPVAAALNNYATNNGLGTYLNMTPGEVAQVINATVSDPAQREQYYQTYNVKGSAASSAAGEASGFSGSFAEGNRQFTAPGGKVYNLGGPK